MSTHQLDDSDRLKPCAFCGSDAEFGEIGGGQDIGGHFVQCLNTACGASSALIFPLMDDVKSLLMERWNKRPMTTPTRTEFEAAALPPLPERLELANKVMNDMVRDALRYRFLRDEATGPQWERASHTTSADTDAEVDAMMVCR